MRALNALTLEVPVGSIFAFLGPNGAGKTTTIRLLLGLLDPTAGRCEVLGFDSRSQSSAIRERAGALLEHHGLYEGLTVEENLEFAGRIHHWPRHRRLERAKEVLERYGLWDRRKSRTGLLSKGMKQKLAIARAVLHRPQIIFLDEPTSGLDPAAAVALRDDLAALAAEEGATIFLTSHNLAEVEKVADLVGVIRNGELQAFGSVDEVINRTKRTLVQIVGMGFSDALCHRLAARPEIVAWSRQPRADELTTLEVEIRPAARVAPIVAVLVEAGAEVEEVQRARQTLEATYLDLMSDGS